MNDAVVKTVHDALMEIARTTTFTPEALKQFEGALKEVKDLTNRVSVLTFEHESLQHKFRSSEAQLSAFRRREEEIQNRELAVSKREAMSYEMEKKTAVAEAKEQVRKEVFDTIFKNTIVRESIQRTATESQPGPHYGSTSLSGTDIVERSSE